MIFALSSGTSDTEPILFVLHTVQDVDVRTKAASVIRAMTFLGILSLFSGQGAFSSPAISAHNMTCRPARVVKDLSRIHFPYRPPVP